MYSIFSKTQFHPRYDVRNQIRISMRSVLHLVNLYVHENSTFVDSDIDVATMSKIASIYLKLMGFGADVFVKDSELMDVWYKFTKRNPKLLSAVLK